MNQKQILNIILQQLAPAGISSIPIKADGSKQPALSQWKPYQQRCPYAQETETWFRPDSENALAIVTGAVSKNLEVLDIDAKDIEPTLRERLTERGLIDLLNQMPCVRTPDGFHYYFRCSQIAGNQKLAQRYVGGKCAVLIETRGEGGYAIAPGSPLATHRTGRPYELATGSFDTIPVISPQQRQEIFDACRELDETAGNNLNLDGVRRSFNESADWEEILEPHRFTLLRTQNGEGFWQKPDSSDTGHQLTTNYQGSDRLYNFSSACPPFEQEVAYDKFTAYALLNQNGVEKAAAHDLFSQGYEPLSKEESKASGKKTAFQELMGLAKAQEIWLDQHGQPFITMRVKNHWESYQLDSPRVRDWLRGAYYDTCGTGVGEDSINQVMGILRVKTDGLARYSKGIRVARHGDRLYYDLCNDEWEYVEISEGGWCVKKDPGPARFVRTQTMQAAPHAVPNGREDALEFFELLNLDAQLDQPDLLLAFMLFALVPQAPHPLLILQGEQGTGKSLTAKAIKKILDPSDPILVAPPHDEDDLVVIANQIHLLAFDNLSGLKPALSDALCRLSSEGGLMKRKLYSDDDAVSFKGVRPVILNGIDDIAERNDLMERAIVFDLPLIGEERRRPEDEFFSALDHLAPGVLGFLFDCLSCMLRELPTTKLDRLPRMADFIKSVTAAAPAIGWEPDHFLDVFKRHQSNVTELRLQFDPVVDVLKRLVDESDFSGTSTNLLSELRSKADEDERAELPNNASTLGKALRRLAPALRTAGIDISIPRRSRQRNIEIRRVRKGSVDAVAPVDEGGADKIL